MLESLQPLRDHIVVKVVPEENSPLIPEQLQRRSHKAVVIAVGPGKRNSKTGKLVPVDVKIGDIVMFSLNDFEDGEFTLIRQGDIFGLVTA